MERELEQTKNKTSYRDAQTRKKKKKNKKKKKKTQKKKKKKKTQAHIEFGFVVRKHHAFVRRNQLHDVRVLAIVMLFEVIRSGSQTRSAKPVLGTIGRQGKERRGRGEGMRWREGEE